MRGCNAVKELDVMKTVRLSIIGRFFATFIPLLFLLAGIAQAGQTGGMQVKYIGWSWHKPAEAADSQKGGAQITFISPADGATVSSKEPLVVKFNVEPGENGDHFHYFLDGDQIASDRQRSGSLDFGPLSPGKHVITFKIATVAHTLIGVEKSLTVLVK